MKKLYLSIDLEKDPWTNQVPVKETLTLLHLLDGQQITFFVSGEVFAEAPDLVATVANSGHEIGLHSYHHKIITDTDFLLQQLLLSKNFIDLYKPQGFRAPCIQLPSGSLDILKKFGFKYDSSAFFPSPVFNKLTELAVSSWPLLPIAQKLTFPRGPFKTLQNFELPYGSGLITTLTPTIQRVFIDHAKLPSIIFIHPWQMRGHSLIHKDWQLILYSFSAYGAVKHLCKHYKLARMNELLNEDKSLAN